MAERYCSYNKLPKNEAKIQFLANIEIISRLTAQGQTYKQIHTLLTAQNKISMSYSAFSYNACQHFPKKRKLKTHAIHGKSHFNHQSKRIAHKEESSDGFTHNNTPELDTYLHGNE